GAAAPGGIVGLRRAAEGDRPGDGVGAEGARRQPARRDHTGRRGVTVRADPDLRIRVSSVWARLLYSAARALRAGQSSTAMRGISKRSVTREYQPAPCMRPIRSSFGVSM